MPEKQNNELYEEIDMLDALVYRIDNLQYDIEFGNISDDEAEMTDEEIFEAIERSTIENAKKSKKGGE